MKQYNNRIFVLLIVAGALMTSCKKESKNIFNMFDVTLTLHETDPYAAKEYNEASIGDSLVIDYTLTSPSTDMYMVCLHKVGANLPGTKIPITEDGKRRNISGKISIKADAVGLSSYRVYPYDKDGVYLGDGYKKITVEVKSDFVHIANRNIYFPDSTGKVLNSFFNLANGKSYSYTTGAAASGEIDFGIYRKPVYNGQGQLTGWTAHLYSVAASPNPFTPYDISGWSSKGTLFSAPVNGSTANFRDMFKSGVAIETEAKKRTINLTQISTDIKAGQFVYFKTSADKYGVFIANAYTQDFEGKPYMNVYVKQQP